MAKFKADLENKTAPVKPKATRKPNQEEADRDRQKWKEIDGKRIRVKYKAFRLPLDFIKELNIYSAAKETPLENIVYDALTEYMDKHK